MLTLNRQANAVYRDGTELRLTHMEYRLLTFFQDNVNVAVTRDTLMREVWHLEPVSKIERTVDVHVARLRRKLGDDSPLETIRSVGYRLSKALEENGKDCL